ncbi:MAG: glucosamine-6-phosphate deaminase [Granulosicoccus sp.]
MNASDTCSGSTHSTAQWTAGLAHVRVFENRSQLGQAAAMAVSLQIQQVVQAKGKARMIFAAAPSQTEFLQCLIKIPGIPWHKVTAFHMDDYIGLPTDAPQRFANWLDRHLYSRVPFGEVHRIEGSGTAQSLCDDYSRKLSDAPIDIVCLGIGVNGHIAFNDPPVADFDDPLMVKVVGLDEVCRRQQVDDGCFSVISDVPTHAITLTVPCLLSADTLFCIVPGAQKRVAVRAALEGPLSVKCPASVLRTHQNCTLFLDAEANPNV